jgi:outer membrane lipoprotein-sorting protein
MINESHDDSDVLLERATDAMRDLPVPPGPDTAAHDRLLGALQIDSGPLTTGSQFQRRRTTLRILGLAASLLIFAAVVGWLAPTGSTSGGAAFAEMLRRVGEVRTAVFKSRAEWTNATPPQVVESTNFVLEPGRMRVEQGEGDGRYISIVDLRPDEKQMLGLYPPKKTAARSRLELPNGFKFTSIMKLFRDLSEGSAKFLGHETIDGRETLEYHGQMASGEYYWLWISAEDHLPVKLVTSGGTDDLKKSSFIQTTTDFRWNVPLDESLFSMEIPEGYTDITPPAAKVDSKVAP